LRCVAIATLLLLSLSLKAGDADLTPKIPPGYKPDGANDEKGMWLELEEYEQAIQRSPLLVKDPFINAYVRDVTCRVTGEYCADLRIYIIRNPYFNASMTANGIVQVWTGLLLRVSSEDELAAVLGHELAHYTQLHTMDRLRRTTKAATSGSIFDMGLLVLTGVSVPVGQLTALASLMAYSRGDESEADLLGAKFMADAGYDPHAAAELWKKIVDEDANAVAKGTEPGLFSKTHPSSADRIVELNRFVDENFPEATADPANKQSHLDMLNAYYLMLMEDQIDTNRFGRTEVLLDRHRQMGVQEELVHFFHGEMYRQRDEAGDMEFAIKAYTLAAQGDNPVPDAYRNLGYIYLKQDNLPQAQYNFRQYLELEPDADDRAMIEFYLNED
jgi:predicted Zn-dependent protease